MAKRAENIETLLFALELLRRIPRNRKITASELHEQLQQADMKRDKRTVQRQLELLSEHFDIERDERSKPYGYRWKENSQPLAVASLTPQESLLLHLAEENLKHLLPAKIMRSMQGFFQQARRNLGGQPHAQLASEWLDKVRVVATTQPLLPPKISPQVFDEVSEALYHNRWLHIDYQNVQGKRKPIEVMPLGLAQQGVRMYLVCRYRGFDNERSLALHRMHAVRASTLTFERPKNFNLKKYEDDGRFALGDGQKITLSFVIEADRGMHLDETPLSKDQKIEHLEDGLLQITATVIDSQMLDWWLNGFGSAIQRISKTPLPAPAKLETDPQGL